jgi:hypothetical protein
MIEERRGHRSPTREEAIDLLLCVADLLETDHSAIGGSYETIGDLLHETIGDLLQSNTMAWVAYLEVSLDGTTMAEDALEAASLLRDGWTPGQKIP